MESFHSCCLCDDFIEVVVGGIVTAPLPDPINFNANQGGFPVPNVTFSFNRTPSSLFNGLTVLVDTVVFKPLSLPVAASANLNNDFVATLSNKVLLEIADNNNTVLARAVLEFVAISGFTDPATDPSPLTATDDVTNISGYFDGFITLTGNGLLKLLPSTLTMETGCNDINTAFSSLYTSNIDLLKKYGNQAITHAVCDVVVGVPSLVLTISDLLNNACTTKCKNRVSSKVIDVINRLKNASNNVDVPNSTANGFSFSLKFIYEINRALGALNKILNCDLAEFLCHEASSSSDECDTSSDDSDSKHKDTSKSHSNKHDTDHGLNQIIQKLTSLETAINRVSQATNDTKREFTKLQEKVSQQDKIVKKVAECVLKK
jgi:hypothetical protein